MSNHNLIASLALFGELYDNNKSVKDIIGDFILNIVILKNTFSCNSMDIKTMLKEEYGFDIPESVVKTTLNGLKNKNKVEKKQGLYIFKQENIRELDNFKDEIKKIDDIQKKIFENLCSFVEENENKSLTKNEKDTLFENFIKYLLDENLDEKYKSLISTFIISTQKEENIQMALQQIKEGAILYQGITYTPDINDLGSWNNSLTIYLATEHLFNAVGYNGELYQEIFNDFYSLVNEINRISKDKNKKIKLVYGENAKQEVDNFFSSAESIIKGNIQPDISRSAMKSILKDCSRVSDVINKKSNFEQELKRKGIEYIQDVDVNPEYNIEDLSIIEKIIEKSKKEIEEKECLDILKIFSQINTKRRGKKSKSFEQSRYIYMVESSLANFLAHQLDVKMEYDDFPFAKNIDFIITQFWFKLNKGLGSKNQSLPKSFLPITKAQLVISSSLNKSIEDRYNETKNKFKKGEINKENLILFREELEKKTKKPEDITYENIDDTFNFLNDENYLETTIRENSLKDAKNKELKEENAELQNYKNTEEAKAN